MQRRRGALTAASALQWADGCGVGRRRETATPLRVNIDPEGLFLFSLNELKRGEHYIPRDLAYQIHMTPRVLTAGATLTMSGVYAGASLGPLLPEVGASFVRACQSEPVKKVAFATCVTIGMCTTDKPKGIGQIARDRERTAEIARMTTQQARRLWQRFVKEN